MTRMLPDLVKHFSNGLMYPPKSLKILLLKFLAFDSISTRNPRLGALVNEAIQWMPPFSNFYGNGMIHRLFLASGKVYGVGFEFIETMQDFTRKNVDILAVNPAFRYPMNGVWAVLFDEVELDPLTNEVLDFKGFQHVKHPGLSGGRVLFNVASIILEHYNVCNAGAYVFSAAEDRQHLRKTDLVDIYNGILGLNGKAKSKLFYEYFEGWEAYSDSISNQGGRGYVVTTQSY
ncbi:hypothetical protein ACVGX7_25275 [Enterobacter hormaechei]|nr:hypothetical protein [Enterobacter hormaechei subsp. steigerwaltii]HAV1935130.1 hypothetical protein [Enterobacter hormaechei subsp. steigerwaltii]HEM7461445.1 hypothetical protein [Enterobacter hormaechei]